MIKVIGNVFKIDTAHNTYLIRINKFNNVICDYFGAKIGDNDSYDFAEERIQYGEGCSTSYSEEDPNYNLDMVSLEVSSVGRGDYREPSVIIKSQDGYTFDPVYKGHEIRKYVPNTSLPYLRNAEELDELVIETYDEVNGVKVLLKYVVGEENDVIIRNTEIVSTKEEVRIIKASSMQFELTNQDFTLLSLYGTWGSENNIEETKVSHQIIKIDSKTGDSSNKHNPFFLIKERDATVSHGNVYSFNLMYSGNHEEIIEMNAFDKVRIQNGISSFCFDWTLKEGDSFETPLSILTFSDQGLNGSSQNMHHFIENHVIRDKDSQAPIVINNWEVTGANFKAKKVKSIIKSAAELGIEMFVLDDGWFSTRDNDHSGLGDYDVNKKKLPKGLNGLANYCEKKEMSFGLWFEPECVNEDSKLFRAHPDWIIHSERRKPCKGRNQYMLDLTRTEVQNYIIENVNSILDNNNISYVKWDMNRHISDVSSALYDAGEMYHRYMLGLYHVFDMIISAHPKVFFEGCSSGGNRFDLGILNWFDQIWTSDDTDAYERIKIQSGAALGYPLRCISNHVACSPSGSVLRKTPIETRINVAMFGSFGFETDLKKLYKTERQQVEKAIAFYKEHRLLVRDGDFYQLKTLRDDGYALFLLVSKNKKEGMLGYFQGLNEMTHKTDVIKLQGFDDDRNYEFSSDRSRINLNDFAAHVHSIVPFINERGPLFAAVAKRFTLDGEEEKYVLSGAALNNGVLKLDNKWVGTGIGEHVRVMPDFASRLYYIHQIDE